LENKNEMYESSQRKEKETHKKKEKLHCSTSSSRETKKEKFYSLGVEAMV
jgi:hypothetical protein